MYLLSRTHLQMYNESAALEKGIQSCSYSKKKLSFMEVIGGSNEMNCRRGRGMDL